MATVRPRLVIAVTMALIGSIAGGCLTEVVAQFPTPTPTRNNSSQGISCVGDCNDDGVVIVGEIVTGVNIALERAEISACPAFACNGPDVDVFINCGVGAVRNALAGCPTRTPTPTPTRTPTPTMSVIYELLEGSTILMSAPTPDASPVVEPLSGTFVVRVDCGDPFECFQVRAPNTLFAMTITSMKLHSPHFTVGGMGHIYALTFYANYPTVGATLLIAGEAIVAAGQGTIETAGFPPPFPPPFSPLELCGRDATNAGACEAIRAGIEPGYVLTLFAVPRP
jgi:hypothetical protein